MNNNKETRKFNFNGKIPPVLYIVRSQSRPEIAILCSEPHLKKWIDRILDKHEVPETTQVTPQQLEQMILPNPILN